MKTQRQLYFILFIICLVLPVYGQENASTPQRTPEQEAVKQTERLQQELNLTPEQVKQVYEINLRYARERQLSNTRSEAVERMKNKNADIQKILTEEQNGHLQTKRYERTTNDPQTVNRAQQVVPPSGFRSPNEYRSSPTVRVPSGDMNIRSSYKATTSPTQGSQQPQAVRRSAQPTNQQSSSPSAAPAIRSTQSQASPPASSRPTTSPSPSVRTESSSGSSRR